MVYRYTSAFACQSLPIFGAISCPRFSEGTVLDDFHALGYLAKGSTYCVAPIRFTSSSGEAVRYWAVGKTAVTGDLDFEQNLGMYFLNKTGNHTWHPW